MKIIKPPSDFYECDFPSIFLAGSIEMGVAEDWQRKAENALRDCDGTILNPRRDDWDSSWEQSINNAKFKEQVEWELMAQEFSSYIMMYFVPDTKSPISLLELGLFARTGKLFVACPDTFWRRGNVEITCKRYGVPFFESLDSMLAIIRGHLE